MENIIDQEVTQLQYMEVKQELWGKAKILGLCTLAFFLMFKLLNNDTSVFSCLKDGFYFALVMYMPFKICYQTTGSIISSFIGSFIIVIIVGSVMPILLRACTSSGLMPRDLKFIVIYLSSIHSL